MCINFDHPCNYSTHTILKYIDIAIFTPLSYRYCVEMKILILHITSNCPWLHYLTFRTEAAYFFYRSCLGGWSDTDMPWGAPLVCKVLTLLSSFIIHQHWWSAVLKCWPRHCKNNVKMSALRTIVMFNKKNLSNNSMWCLFVNFDSYARTWTSKWFCKNKTKHAQIWWCTIYYADFHPAILLYINFLKVITMERKLNYWIIHQYLFIVIFKIKCL